MLIADDDRFEDLVIRLITDYSGMKEYMKAKIRAAKEDYDFLESDIYSYIAMPSPLQSLGVTSHATGSCGQTADLAIRKDEVVQQIREELIMLINMLETELQEYFRIHVVYMVLPMQHHQVLQKRYVDDESCEKIAKDIEKRKDTVCQWRRNGLYYIRAGFFSKLTIRQLLCLQKNAQGGNDPDITWDKIIREYEKNKTREGSE